MGFFYGHAVFTLVDIAALLYQAMHLRSIAANTVVIVATTLMVLALWCMAGGKSPPETCGRWWDMRYRPPARWWVAIADVAFAAAFAVAVWAITVESDRIIDCIAPVLLNAAAHLLHMYTYHSRLMVTSSAWVNDMSVPLTALTEDHGSTAIGEEDDDEVVIHKTRPHRARSSPPLPRNSKMVTLATPASPFTIGDTDEEP